jgi:hypothetical protein
MRGAATQVTGQPTIGCSPASRRLSAKARIFIELVCSAIVVFGDFHAQPLLKEPVRIQLSKARRASLEQVLFQNQLKALFDSIQSPRWRLRSTTDRVNQCQSTRPIPRKVSPLDFNGSYDVHSDCTGSASFEDSSGKTLLMWNFVIVHGGDAVETIALRAPSRPGPCIRSRLARRSSNLKCH